MRIAIYPGSFDPITYGHMDIIERGCGLFDKVVVAIAKSESKNPMFTLEDRINLAASIYEDNDKVAVVGFPRKLTVDLAKDSGACAIIRGLSAVSDFINKGHLEEVVKIIYKSLKDYWNKDEPLIKVLGINPHASDGGYIGNEENEVIIPALQNLKEKGIDTIGPISADTAFIEKEGEKADVFLAMFHDQGLPVIKTMGFGETVNVTLGLPFIRTSVDHGTAYDKAGLGNADESSLVSAMDMAFSMSTKI